MMSLKQCCLHSIITLFSFFHVCASSSIAYITAIYGYYELSAKPKVNQTLQSDWVCFTNNSNLIANGWELDFEPYHLTSPSPIDDGHHVNSINESSSPFLVAKYYKQNFHNIARLRTYDIIIWIDGTIQITWPKTSEWIYNKVIIEKQPIITWRHMHRKSSNTLKEEVAASKYSKYNGQDLDKQYKEYVEHGYSSERWNLLRVANMTHPIVSL